MATYYLVYVEKMGWRDQRLTIKARSTQAAKDKVKEIYDEGYITTFRLYNQRGGVVWDSFGSYNYDPLDAGPTRRPE